MRFTLESSAGAGVQDHNVCIVNSFRSELSHKKAMFALLTDETLTAKFPVAGAQSDPRTCAVDARGEGRQDHAIGDETVDLIEYIKQNREKLVLRPNDDYSDLHSFIGYEHDDGSWERALREAQRAPYVVQETREARAYCVPADELRASGVQGDAGGCAAAGISGQSGRLFELCFRFRAGELFSVVRYRANIYYRREELAVCAKREARFRQCPNWSWIEAASRNWLAVLFQCSDQERFFSHGFCLHLPILL